MRTAGEPRGVQLQRKQRLTGTKSLREAPGAQLKHNGLLEVNLHSLGTPGEHLQSPRTAAP